MAKYDTGTILLSSDLEGLNYFYEVSRITPDGQYVLLTDSGGELRLGSEFVDTTFRPVDPEWGKFVFKARVEMSRLQSPILQQLNGYGHIVDRQHRLLEQVTTRLADLMVMGGMVHPVETQANALLVYICSVGLWTVEDVNSIPFDEDTFRSWLGVLHDIRQRAKAILLTGQEVK